MSQNESSVVNGSPILSGRSPSPIQSSGEPAFTSPDNVGLERGSSSTIERRKSVLPGSSPPSALSISPSFDRCKSVLSDLSQGSSSALPGFPEDIIRSRSRTIDSRNSTPLVRQAWALQSQADFSQNVIKADLDGIDDPPLERFQSRGPRVRRATIISEEALIEDTTSSIEHVEVDDVHIDKSSVHTDSVIQISLHESRPPPVNVFTAPSTTTDDDDPLHLKNASNPRLIKRASAYKNLSQNDMSKELPSNSAFTSKTIDLGIISLPAGCWSSFVRYFGAVVRSKSGNVRVKPSISFVILFLLLLMGISVGLFLWLRGDQLCLRSVNLIFQGLQSASTVGGFSIYTGLSTTSSGVLALTTGRRSPSTMYPTSTAMYSQLSQSASELYWKSVYIQSLLTSPTTAWVGHCVDYSTIGPGFFIAAFRDYSTKTIWWIKSDLTGPLDPGTNNPLQVIIGAVNTLDASYPIIDATIKTQSYLFSTKAWYSQIKILNSSISGTWTTSYDLELVPGAGFSYGASISISGGTFSGVAAMGSSTCGWSTQFSNLAWGVSGVAFAVDIRTLTLLASSSGISATDSTTALLPANSPSAYVRDAWTAVIAKVGGTTPAAFASAQLFYGTTVVTDLNYFSFATGFVFTNSTSSLSPPAIVVVGIPSSDYLDVFYDRKTLMGINFACTIIVVIFVSVATSYFITKSLTNVTDLLNAMTESEFLHEIQCDDVATNSLKKKKGRAMLLESYNLQRSAELVARNLKSFSRYVPFEVVRALVSSRSEAVLGCFPEQVTLLFTDIQSFTKLTEKLTEKELILLLDRYFHAMTDCIGFTGGTVGKFIGDSIMAFWNVPLPVSEHAVLACDSALRMNQLLQDVVNCDELPPIKHRIGIHSGRVLAGNVGCKNRFSFDVLGDNVNLASRLEGINSYYGTTICISEATHDTVNGQRYDLGDRMGYSESEPEPLFLCRELDIICVKGKEHEVRVFELICDYSAATPELISKVHQSDKFIYRYQEGLFQECLTLVVQFLEQFPDDAVGQLYKSRCEELIEKPPNMDHWNPTMIYSAK